MLATSGLVEVSRATVLVLCVFLVAFAISLSGEFAVVLLGPTKVMVGSLHEQHSRKVVEEDRSHPSVHLVRARSAEVPVDDDDRDDDGEDVDDEGEEEVPGDEWDGDGGWRKNLGDEKQEDNQREENGDAHRHLLASIRRKEEDADAEEGDEDARNDEVHGVEECPPPDDEEELDVGAIMSLILAVFLP